MDDDYAIVPEKEVLQMKRDLESLKRNPLSGIDSGSDLITSMNNLTRAINSLIELFQKAAEEIKLEDKSSEAIVKKVEPLFEKIDMLVDQNKKIAKGIVAVADMLEAKQEERPAPQQQQAPYPRQPMYGPAPMPPSPPMGAFQPQPLMPRPLPPQPPLGQPRKGLF